MLKHPIDQSTFRRGVLGAAPCVLPSAFSTMAHRDEYGCRYKACLVANGRSQQFGVDYDDTLSPVVKPAIVRTEFDMTDLGVLNNFLGISVTRDSTGMFLSQKKYDLELLDRAYMANCNPTRTSVDTKSKLGYNGYPISDPTLYRSLAGGLQYLTFTRANISYAVQQHHRTKHIEIDIHFVRDMVARGQVCVLHVPSHYQYADIFTKELPSALFEEFRTSLSVQTSPAQTTGAY
ncbi:ribonuclease H-like domain-containing protein [Tanacetum coccineum]